MPTDPTAEKIRAWVEGRMAAEVDRGRTEQEARRIAWDAWDAIPPAEKMLLLHPPPKRPAYRVIDRKN